MKKILYTIAFVFAATIAANAQAKPDAMFTNLQVKIEQNNLLVEWTGTEASEMATWQVQASTDGKEFSTIGFVMGADPKAANNYRFKQGLSKMKPGLKYYRVLQVAGDDMAYASNTISITK